MKKIVKLIVCTWLLVGSFISVPNISQAEDKPKELIYDLKYDEKKQILQGKTAPFANIYLDNLAGSIVANEKGEFEVPIPKGTKKSIVSALDAEGDDSTDVKFNFEKNTVEKEETSESTGESSASESAVAGSQPKGEAANSAEVTQSSNKNEASSSKENIENESSSLPKGISEEEYDSSTEEEPKRSLIWLWTLLGILVVGGGAVGGYLWYKKKLEAEEKRKRNERKKKGKKKKSRQRSSKKKEIGSDDTEDDLFEGLVDTPKKEKKADADDLEAMITSELEDERSGGKKPSSAPSRHKSSKRKKRKK